MPGFSKSVTIRSYANNASKLLIPVELESQLGTFIILKQVRP
jgi:hypothetical protein